MTVVEISPDGNLLPIMTQIEEPRLGEGIETDGKISRDGFERALFCLRKFIESAREAGAEEIFAFGTQAFRKADNGTRIAEELSRAGANIEILSPEEEARYAFIGATADLPCGVKCIVDIGGGSTEIVWGTASPEGYFSLPIGALTLTEKFSARQPLTPKTLANIRNATYSALEQIPREALSGPLVGVGGTITTLAGMFLGSEEYSPNVVHGSMLPADWIRDMSATFPRMTIRELESSIPFAPSRAEIISAGTIIADEVLSRADADGLRVSDRGARWGILISRIAQ